MESGDILGHENMGEVIELGSEVKNLKIGDRVVVPFTISCGQCFFCQKGLFSCCDRTNPNAEMAAKAMGQSPAGLFGFSHMLGGYAGGQAEYLRVPMADVGPIKIPDNVTDEQALFLSDIFPTGYMAAANAQIEAGDTVAIWGCGGAAPWANSRYVPHCSSERVGSLRLTKCPSGSPWLRPVVRRRSISRKQTFTTNL
jgi:threonine dehydrogenase-like Zn-dependent dehydrogenase